MLGHLPSLVPYSSPAAHSSGLAGFPQGLNCMYKDSLSLWARTIRDISTLSFLLLWSANIRASLPLTSLLLPPGNSFKLSDLPTTQERLYDNAPRNERKDATFPLGCMQHVPSSSQAPYLPLLTPLSLAVPQRLDSHFLVLSPSIFTIY